LHDEFGTWSQGEAAAERYKRGEISYTQWAESDAKYWAGIKVSQLYEALRRIPYQRGTMEVFHALREGGVKTAIVSAGLSVLADKIAKEVGADVAVANELGTLDGILTGEIKVRVAVDEKDRIIKAIADAFSIPIDHVALVGDRANDLAIQQCLRIAFKPKDDCALSADFVVEDDDLTSILKILEKSVSQ
jgi:phosphoserine phosphatase